MSPKLFYEGNYVRIRVLVEVSRPLIRVVSLNIEGEGKKRLLVKYEKIPFFCKHCGLLGHNHEECGDGVWSKKELQYGDFMLASRRANLQNVEPRPFNQRGRGGRFGRGAYSDSRKRSSQEASLDEGDELLDSASSPLKTTAMEISDENVMGARKQLEFDTDHDKELALAGPSEVGNPEEVPPPPPSYTNPRDRTKIRKTAVNDDLATSAASSEEDRRAQ
jgi:hypothetical protein